MPWAHTRIAMDYVRHMIRIVGGALLKKVTYYNGCDVDVPLLFDRCANCYWYRGWASCIDDMSFKLRHRH